MSGPDAPVVLFIGQPNCGKSTLFNAIAGYKAQTSNFPGTSVQHTHSFVTVEGRVLGVIDLPGTYSLHPSDPAEKVALTHLYQERPDVIVNVVDASILGRSLELTLELLETDRPMVVALNMMDLAEKKGIEVDVTSLERRLGVPVIPTIAAHGRGLKELLEATLRCLDAGCRAPRPRLTADVEEAVQTLVEALPDDLPPIFNKRFTAVQMIESGPSFCDDFLGDIHPRLKKALEDVRRELSARRRLPAYEAVDADRHHLAQKIFEETCRVRRAARRKAGERLDDLLMHPLLGYPILTAVVLGMFFLIFKVGGPLESWLLKPLTALKTVLGQRLGGGIVYHVADGILQGIGGGVAIVLPYFLPLLLLTALLDDIGYLARAGFLLDTFMHRIGLHGKSVSPLILGFGCNVPAITATRILESRRDRILTSLLIPFIPCSARMTIILALVAFFLGPSWALGFYAFNILLVAVLSRVLSLFWKDESPGLILEIPSLKVPSLRNMVLKIWFQLKSFLKFAWPLLIAGSAVLGLIQSFRADAVINRLLAPIVAGVLGLPQELGITLIFGFLRKELSLLMMLQALNVDYPNLLSVISRDQVIVFTVFVCLFIPCLSTFVVLWKESGKKVALLSAGLSFAVALAAGFLVRLIL
jgi:ferrous iron transport protein B